MVKIYTGTFDPVTYAHMRLAEYADLIVCGKNPAKKPVLTPEDAKELWWKLGWEYRVTTLDQYRATGEEVILVRGVRGPEDLLDEMKVFELNHELFGINRFELIWTEDKCSSTKVRELIAKGEYTEALKLIPKESLEAYLRCSGA